MKCTCGKEMSQVDNYWLCPDTNRCGRKVPVKETIVSKMDPLQDIAESISSIKNLLWLYFIIQCVAAFLSVLSLLVLSSNLP